MVLCGRPLVKILCMRYGHSPQVVWKPNGKCNSTRLALTVRCKLFRQLSEPLFFSCLENFPLQIQVINALSKHKRGAGEGETYKSVSCAISNAYFCISLPKKVFLSSFWRPVLCLSLHKKGGGRANPHPPSSPVPGWHKSAVRIILSGSDSMRGWQWYMRWHWFSLVDRHGDGHTEGRRGGGRDDRAGPTDGNPRPRPQRHQETPQTRLLRLYCPGRIRPVIK